MKNRKPQLEALDIAIANLEVTATQATDTMVEIVKDFWDRISFENSSRKTLAPDPSQPDPNWHRPTPLSLSMKREGETVYVSWVRQDSSLQKKSAVASNGPRKAPYKSHIAKGAAAGHDGYLDRTLEKHMRGWERELVLQTEAMLKQQRRLHRVSRKVLKELTALRSAIAEDDRE